ncbi:MAG TPA: class I SAM-dependent methyltransferase [Candidatus Binataceae bacterium]|nr:class I SAM-dependent methyltransferase [Candidatus Binataceae bacterium]
MSQRVNYDQIAATFDARYAGGIYAALLDTMREFVATRAPATVLEVGCGTGYWISALRDLTRRIVGLDYSREMLRAAREKNPATPFVRGTATALPFRRESFDLIFCINALHHFGDVDGFVAEARRLMRPAGALAVIGMDPHHGRDQWCVYEYFPETRAIDLERYPSSGAIVDAMLKAGFDRVETSLACRLSAIRLGRTILENPGLRKNGSSQMALLSDGQYAAGIARIESAIERARGGPEPIFEADIALMMVCGTIRD